MSDEIADLRAELATVQKRITELEQAGTLLYRQVLDANGWINLGATWPGAGLCICTVAGARHRLRAIPCRARCVEGRAARGGTMSDEAKPDLALLAKLASGDGGRRTGVLKRLGYLTWTVTEAGRQALAAWSGGLDQPYADRAVVDAELETTRAELATVRARCEALEGALRKYPEYGWAWCDAMSETSMRQSERGSEKVRLLEAEFKAALDAATRGKETP